MCQLSKVFLEMEGRANILYNGIVVRPRYLHPLRIIFDDLQQVFCVSFGLYNWVWKLLRHLDNEEDCQNMLERVARAVS